MVSLASVSGAGGSLYLEIRGIELHGERTGASYRISGMVGDGCDEALIRVELGALVQVEIIPICNDDGSGGTLDGRVATGELTRLILEALRPIYFCIDAPAAGRAPGRVTGYADGGRLFRLHQAAKPGPLPVVAESGPLWRAA